MSSSEEDYGRTERPLHKPSHSAHSHGKSKYSENSATGRYSESRSRIAFSENAGSASSRYNENSANQRFSNGSENGRYSSSDGSGSPRYSETSTRFGDAGFPGENVGSSSSSSSSSGSGGGGSGRGSRFNESSGNSYYEGKGSRYAENRLSSDEDRFESENGNRYSERERSSSGERYPIPPPSPASNTERYAPNEHYVNNDRTERFSADKSDRYIIVAPERLDRSSERSSERYNSSERNYDRISEKQCQHMPERYVSGNERYIIHNIQDSNSGNLERVSDKYGANEKGSERFSERYLQSSERTSKSDKFIDGADSFRGSERKDYRSERFVQSPSLGDVQRFDRYCTLPSHSERCSKDSTERFENSRYLPPPAPAPSDRYNPPERYIPPPAPSNDRFSETIRERFSETPSRDRYQDRYIPPPAPERFVSNSYDRFHSSSVNPGDPYMRRDLGYHHHYRLPHPNYHIHHQSNYYHPHYQRTLPHRTVVSYHPHHSILPSPTRAQLRCCPSPNHYVQPDDLGSASSTSSSQSANVLTANLSGPSLPVLAASLTNGQNLTSFSASVNVNIVTAQATSTLPRERDRDRDRDRDYIPPCTSPLLGRGRTPPVGSLARMPSNVEYLGASGGRHVSTPTPPPSLPRCSSLSNCEVTSETPSCKGDHSHHHYPPARRSCSGVLESGSGSCCNSSRRNANSCSLNIGSASNQQIAAECATSDSGPADSGRSSVAVSCVVSASPNTLIHSTVW